jgi:hypothetical protein
MKPRTESPMTSTILATQRKYPGESNIEKIPNLGFMSERDYHQSRAKPRALGEWY